MVERQEAKAEYLTSLLEMSPNPRNQIAATSGLSNAYIRILEGGNIANVGREKLIPLAIALNLNLQEIDEMLTVFDRAKLTEDDIPIFLEASKRIKISSAMHPLRDLFAIELVFLSAERIPGRLALVNVRPMAAVRPEGHRKYTDKHLVEAHPIYGGLIEAIGRERRRHLVTNLARHPVEHYIHEKSLEDYIRNCTDSEERSWRKKHVESLLFHYNTYYNLQIYLTTLSPSFIFSITFPHESDKYSEKLLFMGARSDFFLGERSGLLAGFATDNQTIIQNYKNDLVKLKNCVIEKYLDRHSMTAYLEALISD